MLFAWGVVVFCKKKCSLVEVAATKHRLLHSSHTVYTCFDLRDEAEEVDALQSLLAVWTRVLRAKAALQEVGDEHSPIQPAPELPRILTLANSTPSLEGL
eukprot:5910559-Amphidinium_carterae.1